MGPGQPAGARGDALVTTADALAARIAANGPLADAQTKRVVAQAPFWRADELWARQREILEQVIGSEDAREARAPSPKRARPGPGAEPPRCPTTMTQPAPFPQPWIGHREAHARPDPTRPAIRRWRR